MTVSPARREFIFALADARSYEQAVQVCIETRRSGSVVSDREILADLISWDELRKAAEAEVQYVRTT